jgi:integrase
MTAGNVTTKVLERGDYYHIWISWYNSAGQRKRTTVSTGLRIDGNNKRKAEARRKELQAEYEAKITPNDNDMLFSDWLLQWIEEVKESIALSTYTEYKRQITKRICPYFEERKIKLRDLKPYHIQEFYSFKMEHDGVKATTVQRYHANIHSALKHAVNMERLRSNPADKVKLPKVTKYTADYYTIEELKTLLSAVKGSQIETPILLASWFGMRRGEIIGLRWSSIDFKNNLLTVNGVVSDKNPNGTKVRDLYFVETPKTDASVRTFPMPQAAVYYLKCLKANQDYRRKRNPKYNHQWDDFVCVRVNGDLIPLEYVTRTFRKVCKNNGLRPIHFHDLRHTNITLLVEQGANMKYVQTWAGHSNYKTTADIYSHVQTADKQTLTEIIDSALGAS